MNFETRMKMIDLLMELSAKQIRMIEANQHRTEHYEKLEKQTQALHTLLDAFEW